MRPIVICGCHGGGTSFTAKLLRYSGLFLGADAGAPEARKHHESRIFRSANQKVLEAFGDERGMIDSVVKRAIEQLSADDAVVKLSNEIDIEKIFSIYWKDSAYVPIWGWKDPRNSITYPIWKKIFPYSRTVIVQKVRDRLPAKSRSGHWFRYGATEWLIAQYMQPFWMRNDNLIKTISFDRITKDHEAFNDLLAFCGLCHISKHQWYHLLERTGYEHSLD